MPAPEIGGPRRFAETHMDAAELYRLGCGTVSVFSARSPDRRGVNEDAAALIPVGKSAAVLAVADGVGGLPGGAEAAATVIEALLRHVGTAVPNVSGLRDAILSAIEDANRRILSRGTGSATTLALAELHADSVRTYHVGDSMILVTNRHGEVKAETLPHSPVGYAVESGLMSESAAARHGERHLVSNVIGSGELHVSVGALIPFAVHDTLLLATDGLADNVRKRRIVELMRNGSLDACSRSLTGIARRRMSGTSRTARPDDLTLILYRRDVPRRRRRVA
jgi:serine/threonine protein phosphatase PrpC